MGYLLLHSGQLSAKRLLKRVAECNGADKPGSAASRDVVIRWGNTAGDDRVASYTLNPRQAIENAANRTRMLRILKLNGVYAPSLAQEWTNEFVRDVLLDSGRRVKMERWYQVPLFDLQPLALFRADNKDVWLERGVAHAHSRFREVAFDEDVYATRAVRLAIRSLRALGLDFGLVSIGITARDRTICMNVTPTPVLHGQMLGLFADALQAFITRDSAEERNDQGMEANSPRFRMGADLEFMLRSSRGKLLLASKYLPRRGRVGCDDLSINRDGKRFPIAELRPDPAETPEGLMANIWETMGEAFGLIKSRSAQWLAGSMPLSRYSLGGHLHYSDLPFSSRLVKALDTYLGFPVMMIEATDTAMKRRPQYGFLGDIRFKSHGGFEYRTPASWIVSPEVAAAVIALGYLVGVHYRELRTDLFVRPKKQRQFYRAEKSELQSEFQAVWREIEKTATYRRYREELRVIPEMVQQGIDWNEAVDIRTAWGLSRQDIQGRSGPVPNGTRRKGRDLITR